MSASLAILHRTQIVVSGDSDDEAQKDERLLSHGPTSSPLASNSRAGTNDGDINPLSHKYPHTKSCLVGIVRENRLDGDLETDEFDSLLQQVISALKEENEDELKILLKSFFELSEDAAEQSALDLMHSHRDDINQAPLTVLHSAKRPISRPSSRASSHSFRLNRPESPLANYGATNGSVPSSPKPIQLAFRRPHTPVTSPLVSTLHTSASSYMAIPPAVSPTSSPTLQHATVLSLAAASPSSSPLSSPRFLNAKEFRPGRPLSIGSNPSTPSGNPWAGDVPPSSLTRSSSNLAVAAPLVLTPRSATPVGTQKAENIPSRPSSSLAVPSKPPFDDDDDDEFSPFSKPKPILYKSNRTTSFNFAASSSEDAGGTSENSASSPSNSYEISVSVEEDGTGAYGYREYSKSSMPYDEEGWRGEDDPLNMRSQGNIGRYPYRQRYDRERNGDKDDSIQDPNAPEGMTPLDVLVSVFGATISPVELENVLAQHGWNFDETMQFLIERGSNGGERGYNPPSRQGSGMNDERQPIYVGRQGGGRGILPFSQQPRQMSRPGRVCRYFLAGECLRADCRFSHDLDRALCRFWLRGVCAKGDNCEFMHRLPPNAEGPPFVVNPNVNGKNSRFDDRNIARYQDDDAFKVKPILQDEEFPALGSAPENKEGYRPVSSRQGSFIEDQARARQGNALGKSINSNSGGSVGSLPSTGPKSSTGSQFNEVLTSSPVSASTIAPKASSRIKLKPATLLPVIPTSDALDKLYTAYRDRPLQLQSARNACLARAADAWRRNDGPGAKRFSRDANELNIKMSNEARDAAGKVVRERCKLMTNEILAMGRIHGAGRPAGGGLGIVLGLANSEIGSSRNETEDMRIEVAIDLHGLYATEGVDYLEEFLINLEKEHHLGLTYIVIGDEASTSTQDPTRGPSKQRLAAAIKEWLHRWGYPWNESNGILCVDCLTHY